MRLRRKVAVVTSSRADYGHLFWVLKELSARPDIEMKLIVLGSHLSPEFGNSVKEIERDGFVIAGRVECLLSSDTDVGMAKTLGVAVLGLADVLADMRPSLLLLIADRYEMLAPASVALTLRLPIAHIEGGEVSEGAIDDAVRNALTKMAHLHFTSTNAARDRVIALGEEPWRVHRAGAPSLDHVHRSRLLDKDALQCALGISLEQEVVLVGYHPVTLLHDTTQEADALFEALDSISGQVLFCHSNPDAGGYDLMERCRRFCERRDNSHLFVNLRPTLYWSLLRHASLLVGNSSSGIMEAASFAIPVVNIGLRQYGRERARNTLDAEASIHSILEQVELASSQTFRDSIAGMENPYGDGHASERIAQVIATAPLDTILRKRAAPEMVSALHS